MNWKKIYFYFLEYFWKIMLLQIFLFLLLTTSFFSVKFVSFSFLLSFILVWCNSKPTKLYFFLYNNNNAHHFVLRVSIMRCLFIYILFIYIYLFICNKRSLRLILMCLIKKNLLSDCVIRLNKMFSLNALFFFYIEINNNSEITDKLWKIE